MPKKPEVVTLNLEDANAFSVTIPNAELQIARFEVKGTSAIISEDERAVLKKLLDRNRTSMAVHGGLKSLLVLSDEEALVLLGFLERV